MRIWRICRKPHAGDPLSGRGGLFTSGRWHTKGQRIIYTSRSLALAALEILVHVDRDMLPADLLQLEMNIPDKVKVLEIGIKELPKNWQSYPAPAVLQRLGDDWLASESTAVLEVPSAVIPEENNLLLNPRHADASNIRVLSTKDFAYDSRLT